MHDRIEKYTYKEERIESEARYQHAARFISLSLKNLFGGQPKQ